MTPIVTSLDRAYLPGLKALYNSYIKNSQEGFEFWAILDGDSEFESEVQDLGVRTIMNPDMGADFYPVSDKWPLEIPAMYWRAMIPGIFNDSSERSIYIDADSIILNNLQPLIDMKFDQPFAASYDNNMGASTGGLPDDLISKAGFISSLMVFNNDTYIEAGILEKCVDIMRDTSLGYEFKTAIQGVMQLATIESGWSRMSDTIQIHAVRSLGRRADCVNLVLHCLGANPWDEADPQHIKNPNVRQSRIIWKEYA